MSNDGWGKGWPIKPKGVEQYTQQGNALTGWPDTLGKAIAESREQGKTVEAKVLSDMIAKAGEIIIEQFLPTGIDLGAGDSQTVLTTLEDGTIKQQIIPESELYGVAIDSQNPWTGNLKEYKNKVPTHDPYTNPNAHIYYECKCGQILDPGTKSFAELNNQASKVGWKVRWGDKSYVPYCVECGKGVE